MVQQSCRADRGNLIQACGKNPCLPPGTWLRPSLPPLALPRWARTHCDVARGDPRSGPGTASTDRGGARSADEGEGYQSPGGEAGGGGRARDRYTAVCSVEYRLNADGRLLSFGSAVGVRAAPLAPALAADKISRSSLGDYRLPDDSGQLEPALPPPHTHTQHTPSNAHVAYSPARGSSPPALFIAYFIEVRVHTRDATIKKITNQNQTDTNEMTITETKYQTDFYSANKYQY